jgi:hypothetical protein
MEIYYTGELLSSWLNQKENIISVWFNFELQIKLNKYKFP